VIAGETVSERNDFVEKLTHDSYFIQVGRIKNNRYGTHLEKLLSIFEQSNFVSDNSEVLKEYRHNPDVEEIKIITGILHEMGADPEERKRIENEAEFVRTIDATYGIQIREQAKIIEEQNKSLEEKDKIIKGDKKSLEEKDKSLEAQTKSLEEKDREIAELKRLLQDKQLE
ncbi:MAG: hypothetical protein LBK58_09225, partial [Prevotellaceae bacterium]|jgi:hypothetical protein|nr:hypothetical protein [Prevotellaceae bacterium]